VLHLLAYESENHGTEGRGHSSVRPRARCAEEVSVPASAGADPDGIQIGEPLSAEGLVNDTNCLSLGTFTRDNGIALSHSAFRRGIPVPRLVIAGKRTND